jgi:hypothetical protein
MNSLQLTPQQSQMINLLSTTTGILDVYVIQIYHQLPWLIPQNLLLAALNASADITSLEWRQQELPVLSLHDPANPNPIALVLESIDEQPRFAVLVDSMPDTQRVRISSLRDDHVCPVGPMTFQVVMMEGQPYQVPDFNKIGTML